MKRQIMSKKQTDAVFISGDVFEKYRNIGLGNVIYRVMEYFVNGTEPSFETDAERNAFDEFVKAALYVQDQEMKYEM